MAISEREFHDATARTEALRQAGHAVAAAYDPRTGSLVIRLHGGAEVRVPVALVEGLAGADPAALSVIEITPAGLGLHLPRLDADVWLPAILPGLAGSAQPTAAPPAACSGRERKNA